MKGSNLTLTGASDKVKSQRVQTWSWKTLDLSKFRPLNPRSESAAFYFLYKIDSMCGLTKIIVAQYSSERHTTFM
jgi:hypothetical protein